LSEARQKIEELVPMAKGQMRSNKEKRKPKKDADKKSAKK